MPQMKPINWLFLFFLFTLIMYFINTLNYFSFNIKYKSNFNFIKFNNNKTLNWKW